MQIIPIVSHPVFFNYCGTGKPYSGNCQGKNQHRVVCTLPKTVTCKRKRLREWDNKMQTGAYRHYITMTYYWSIQIWTVFCCCNLEIWHFIFRILLIYIIFIIIKNVIFRMLSSRLLKTVTCHTVSLLWKPTVGSKSLSQLLLILSVDLPVSLWRVRGSDPPSLTQPPFPPLPLEIRGDK